MRVAVFGACRNTLISINHLFLGKVHFLAHTRYYPPHKGYHPTHSHRDLHPCSTPRTVRLVGWYIFLSRFGSRGRCHGGTRAIFAANDKERESSGLVGTTTTLSAVGRAFYILTAGGVLSVDYYRGRLRNKRTVRRDASGVVVPGGGRMWYNFNQVVCVHEEDTY